MMRWNVISVFSVCVLHTCALPVWHVFPGASGCDPPGEWFRFWSRGGLEVCEISGSTCLEGVDRAGADCRYEEEQRAVLGGTPLLLSDLQENARTRWGRKGTEPGRSRSGSSDGPAVLMLFFRLWEVHDVALFLSITLYLCHSGEFLQIKAAFCEAARVNLLLIQKTNISVEQNHESLMFNHPPSGLKCLNKHIPAEPELKVRNQSDLPLQGHCWRKTGDNFC